MLTIGEFARLGQVSPRMLRHYDELGLLRPERVDQATGYRFHEVAQLARLHRLLALRDLGFGLDQIDQLLDENLPPEQLRGMLRLRQAQIEQRSTRNAPGCHALKLISGRWKGASPWTLLTSS
jgi:DNA-binding transcriptional MerR regulator